MRKLYWVILLLNFSLIHAQSPFSKGVNLSNWFQTSNARQIQFTKFTKHDLENIRSLGCDVVRLPINLHAMTSGSPDYTLDPIFVMFLDSVVSWAESLHLYLILDNHSFDPSVNTQSGINVILNKVWKQMAHHYKDRSEYILYEVLNEPHGLTTQVWGSIQQEAINAIRTEDTKHYIVVGGSGYNSYNELKNLPVYTDTKLIYTFHFYDPFVFTHQGASWVDPSMVPLAGVTFPYDAAKMPVCPSSLKGSWIENSLNNYGNDGTVAKVKSLIDIAVSFKATRNVPVFCGEFGVYIPNSDNTDRVYWYNNVHNYLEEKGIPWTSWDYTGGFGIFKKNSDEMFDYNVNLSLIQNMGLTQPPQLTYVLKADSVGFPLYSDYIEKNINQSGGGTQTVDYYSANLPNNGKYCLLWSNASQYGSVGFDFKPNKDLSGLVAENYALDLLVRGNNATAKFDIRFIDTKASDTDHPWRIRTTIDNSVVPMDKRWHHVRIPLKSFTEHGSWDNNTWYNPEGKFDWKAIDRMEIVAEYANLTGMDLWFDNITLSDKDTAVVREGTVLETPRITRDDNQNIKLFPNPAKDVVTLSWPASGEEEVDVSVFTITGRKVRSLSLKKAADSVECDLYDLESGVYIVKLRSQGGLITVKLIKD